MMEVPWNSTASWMVSWANSNDHNHALTFYFTESPGSLLIFVYAWSCHALIFCHMLTGTSSIKTFPGYNYRILLEKPGNSLTISKSRISRHFRRKIPGPDQRRRPARCGRRQSPDRTAAAKLFTRFRSRWCIFKCREQKYPGRQQYHPGCEQGRLIRWVITASDLLKTMGNFAGADEIGGLIVLEMERTHFAISGSSRIVESNDCTILHLNTTTNPRQRVTHRHHPSQ